MKKAYLILAHGEPAMLRRIVGALRCDGAAFYVHIDGKVGQGSFVTALEDFEHVRFVEPVRVQWGGFSLVEATLRLMALAHADGADRFTLLSGADYPIKSNAEIFEFLSASRLEYISFWRLEDRPSWLHKVRYYYPIELIPLYNYRESLFRRAFWGTFIKVRRFMPRRRFPTGLTPFGGSQWWTLTRDCVGYVLDYVAAHEAFVRFYRTTHAPDEGFFQTIVMNSEFATRVASFDRYERWRLEARPWEPVDLELETKRKLPDDIFNFRYVDWSEEFTGKREAPAILDERDFDALRRSKCLLARKFEPRRSEKLLDQIDRLRRGQDPA